MTFLRFMPGNLIPLGRDSKLGEMKDNLFTICKYNQTEAGDVKSPSEKLTCWARRHGGSGLSHEACMGVQWCILWIWNSSKVNVPWLYSFYLKYLWVQRFHQMLSISNSKVDSFLQCFKSKPSRIDFTNLSC